MATWDMNLWPALFIVIPLLGIASAIFFVCWNLYIALKTKYAEEPTLGELAKQVPVAPIDGEEPPAVQQEFAAAIGGESSNGGREIPEVIRTYLEQHANFLRSSALAATPACSEQPATLPTWSTNGSLQSGSVCRVNNLRPACGPTAMRYVIE